MTVSANARKPRLAPLPEAVASTAGLTLLAISRGGADFGRYRDWALAFVHGDIFLIGSPVQSPLGLPLSQAAHGPGLMFALVRRALGAGAQVEDAAMVLGWLAAIVFWWAMWRILRLAAAGNPSIIWMGMSVAFLGTHAGYYSRAHATESLALALTAVVALLAVERRPSLAGSALAVGSATGLLLVTRPYLAVYAVPALAVVAEEVVRGGRDRGGRHGGRLERAAAGASLALGIGLGLLQVLWANRWMTGDPARSPYVYGGEGFRSLDWLQPEFLAVLLHPWHGLLVYHPLYVVGFVAALLCIRDEPSRRGRLLWGAAVGAMLANLYVQAAWSVWWMGTETFGSRGMVAAAVPAVAALARRAGRAYRQRRWEGHLWVGLAFACSLWSFLLLVRGPTQFFSLVALRDAQSSVGAYLLRAPTVGGFLLGLLLMAGLARWLRGRATSSSAWNPPARAASSLGALAVAYVVTEASGQSWARTLQLTRAGVLTLLLVASVGVLVQLSGATLRRRLATQRAHAAAAAGDGERRRAATGIPDAGAIVSGSVVAAFIVGCIVFADLAIRTETRLAAGDLPTLAGPVRTFHVTEVLGSYREYQSIGGFEDKKAAFRRFLESEGVLR